MIEIYAVEFSKKMENSLFNKLLLYVSEEKKLKIRRFRKWEDKQRTLIADILIRNIISNETKLRNEDIYFSVNKYGKPFFKTHKNFHFNISHSGKWVVCGISNVPIGVDIEKIKKIDIEIAKHYFSKEEYNELLNKSEQEKLHYFYNLWTLKESYIKAVGKGLSIPIDSLTIKINNGVINLETENELKECYFRQYDIDSDYILSACVTTKALDEDVVVLNFEEICKGFIATQDR